jgi:hypothetical protein
MLKHGLQTLWRSFYYQCDGITMVGGSVVIGGSSAAAVLRAF